MAGVRPFAEDDVPRVADLLWKVLHERRGSAPETLVSYVQDLFLRNPWLEDGPGSHVYEDAQGKLVGFFGGVPRRMSLLGQPIRLRFGSNFVVDPESRASWVAMPLLKSLVAGPQDISITDSANELSRKLLRSMGFQVVPVYSVKWARPLRPSYALFAMSRLKKSPRVELGRSLSTSLSRAADALTARIPFSPFRVQPPPAVDAQELDVDTLLGCLERLPRNKIVPDYDRGSLDWLLKFVAEKNTYGDLRKVVLRDRDQSPLGWYVFGVNPGGVGQVLQLGVEKGSMETVLDHLFHDAWTRGLIALHGRLEPQYMQELTDRSCFFFRGGTWTLARSAKPELLAQIQAGNAFFSRLEGEDCLGYEPDGGPS